MVLQLAPAQLDLFGVGEPHFDPALEGFSRHRLGGRSWLEVRPALLGGAEALFDHLVEVVPWRQHRRSMYERMVDEPRLTAWYDRCQPWPHPVLERLADALGRRYGVEFATAGLNLYRDGRDSVAWHGDKVAAHVPEPTIAILVLGPSRPFLVRPKGGGPSRPYLLGWGDLLVMGGRCQQEWDHAVPKVAGGGPRISVVFRQLEERPEEPVREVPPPPAARPTLAGGQAVRPASRRRGGLGREPDPPRPS